MRTLVLGMGQFCLSLFVLVGIIGSIVGGFYTGDILFGAIVAASGIALIISLTFGLYLLIDIKESLTKQNRLIEDELKLRSSPVVNNVIDSSTEDLNSKEAV